jgi:PEGA domain
MRAAAAFLLLCSIAAAEPAPKKVVAVLEYRAGAKGAVGIGERLAKLLKANAAFEVIDPMEARRRSARIDGEVAKCSGDAMCVGTLGERIGADEVLLVGVSQLGDVVLAMQRIDARKGESGARLAESLAADTEPMDDELLGWLRQLYPPEAFRRYAAIQVMADVDGAEVTLNGEASGKTPIGHALEVRAPASYRVKIEKPGYVPFQAKIDVLPDATVEVRATLSPRAQPQPWFKRWYVWAAVGGAVAIAGAGVAIYYGTRTDQSPQGYILQPPQGP